MLLQKIRYLLQGDRFYADCYEYSEKKSDDEENTANKTRFDDGTMSGEAKKSSGLSYVLTSVASVAFVAQHEFAAPEHLCLTAFALALVLTAVIWAKKLELTLTSLFALTTCSTILTTTASGSMLPFKAFILVSPIVAMAQAFLALPLSGDDVV